MKQIKTRLTLAKFFSTEILLIFIWTTIVKK